MPKSRKYAPLAERRQPHGCAEAQPGSPEEVKAPQAATEAKKKKAAAGQREM